MKKIYPIFTILLLLFSGSISLQAQNAFFTAVSENAITIASNGKRVTIPEKYKTFQADVNQLRNFLWSLPSEKNVTNRNQAPVLELPMPDGSTAKFHVWESSIMEPGLEAKFPEMKTFAGQGITDRYATIRFDYNPYFGFSAQILSAVSGRIIIDPYARKDVKNYISYYSRDFKSKDKSFVCEVPENINSASIINAGPCRGTQLYTYRLALACTGEYAVAVAGPGPTVPAVAAAMLIAVNRVTGVYETEASIRMILVANNNNLIFLDGATDPYTNNSGGAMLSQNINTCNSIIGSGNYDIGHVFSTGGGGVAFLGVICTGNKGGGVTGLPNPVGDPFYIDYVAHEMGHQYSGNHTFNSTIGSCGGGNRNASTAYEVGSGTSIQAYAGICGGDNTQPNSDPFFHTVSFDEISNYASATGGTCAAMTPTGNTLPVITTMNNNGANIPIGTPFTLTATATDADGDPLTYNWEEWDLGPATTWNGGNANTTSPLFKSRVPKISGSRTFPDIAVILAGFPAAPAATMGGLKGETLPTTARTLKFRLTVRDNRAGGGGVVTGGDGCQGGFTSTFQINTIATAGPFAVSAPNGGESWVGGTAQTITWNVVGTDGAPINCSNVKISMSTDGGLTYPTVLAASTPNDGSESLTIPGPATTTARIKVEAVGNIFFDISNANFTVTAPVAGFEFTSAALTATVTCNLATSATATLGTISNGGYVTPISLSASGNPAGTTVSFSTNPVVPGNNADVILNNTNTLVAGTYNILVTGISGAITQTKTITYTIQPGSGPTINTQPLVQTLCTGGTANFSIAAASALSFQWQESTNGGAAWNNITNGGVYSGAATTGLTLTGVTATMNTYLYRVIVNGQCNNTTSSTALLTVNTPPAIATQPAASTICATQNTTFTVVANGNGLSYQWQVNTGGCAGPTWSNVANGAPYSGATTATLTITGATTALTNYAYRCVVTGSCAPTTATSNCVALVVNTPVSVTTAPASTIICAGATANFSVVAAGTSPTYQWQESTNGGANWTNVTNAGIYSGATTAGLTLTGVTAAMNNYQYRAVVSGATACASLNSTSAVLTVNTAPAITTQPATTTTLCVGLNTTYTVAANGTAVTYQWQLSTTGAAGPWNNIANGGVYSGATTASLTLTGVTAAMNSYQYRAVVSGTCAPAVNSNTNTLTVNSPITVTTQPVATTNVCATGTASFTTAVTGTSPVNQWQESTNGGASWTNITNGGIYGGATTSTLTLTGITAAMNGYVYRNVITGAAPCGAVNSQNAVLNVTPQPVISASLTSLLAGQQSTLTVNVTPAPGLSFAWYLNGILLPAFTGNSIVANVNGLGNYRVIVTSATGSCTSELKEITATPSNRLFIFPSPNDGRFTVSYYTAGASLTTPTKQSITIYDSYGRRVHTKEYAVTQSYQLHQIDLRRNGAGVYYIVLREANGNKIKTGEVLVR